MKAIGLKYFSIDIKEYPQIEWKPFFLYYRVRKDKIIQAKIRVKVVAAASTPNHLIKEKAWETLQYVCLDKRFPDNSKRTRNWQQILQFSLVQQAFKEKKEENQKLEVIREKVKVKLEPGQSENQKRKVIPEKEEETCQTRNWEKEIAQWKSLGLTVKIVDQDNANPKFIVKYIPCGRNVETTKSEFRQDNVKPKPNTTLEMIEIISID
jgi:hypothetical protein